MTVKRWSRGPGAASIGKPAVHPASVELKGKAYEYDSVAMTYWISLSLYIYIVKIRFTKKMDELLSYFCQALFSLT